MSISLDSGWQCASSETFSDALPVPALDNLPGSAQQITYLRRSFDLDVTDYCVSYMLCLDSAPSGIEIVINDEQILLDGSPPYRVDVTMNVALDDNEILIQIPPGASGSITGLRLEPVPCE